VIAAAVMRAGSGSPGLAICRGPQTNAETTAPFRQVTGEELTQLGVEDHDRISDVKAMAVVKGRRQNFVEGHPAIRGVGRTRKTAGARVVVIKVGDDGLALILGAG